MTSRIEKGGTQFAGITLLLCENPLPPLVEAIAAAMAVLPRSNHYTEPFSAPLRVALARQLGLNPTSLLPGAISLAEPRLVKANCQFSFDFGQISPAHGLIRSF